MRTRTKGELLNYNGSVPGGKAPGKKPVSKEINTMINSLIELPSGQFPKALYPQKQKT